MSYLPARLDELKESTRKMLVYLEHPEPGAIAWWNSLAQASKELQAAMVAAGVMQPGGGPCTCPSYIDLNRRCPVHGS
jgi:hypothetical protein